MDTKTDRKIEQTNTVADAIRNLSQIREIEIATTPREKIWEDGKVSLFHFKRDSPPKAKTPVLIVYALVNRWEMMDLQPDRSFIRKLLEEGMDVYVVDWGYAGRFDRYKTMGDYILGNIDDCVDLVREKSGLEKINLMGVCQGGTFSIIYAALRPQKIKNFVNIITPVDFDNDDGLLFRWAKDMDVDATVDHFGGVIPGSFLNMGFDLLKPMNKARKYMSLPDIMQNKDKLMNFFRMEQWVADSPSQAGETFRQFIKDFYQKNKLVKGKFELEGERVDLKKITMPVLSVYAREDHIVPPETTKPLNDLIGSKDKELMEFPGGHIGVFVGSRSQRLLTPAIAEWLLGRD